MRSSLEKHSGLRYLPKAFTEHGVLMLSSVLNSEQAIAVNINIIWVFVKIREILMNQKELLLKLEKLEQSLVNHHTRLDKQENEIQIIFKALKKLILNKPLIDRKKIGYRANSI